MSNEIVKYVSGGQEVMLTADTVKKYLVAGNANNLSDQEIVLFQELCKYRGLNPFLREAYLIKYGSQPATMVVGKDAILKKALSNTTYGGHEAGITVISRDAKIDRRAGSMLLPREELVGGWCKVVKVTAAGSQSIMHEVSYDEYCMKDETGKPKSNWKTKPATMIRKVALCQALREAFPEDLAGMYEPEEMGIDEKNLPVSPVDVTKVVADITPVHTASNVTTVTPEPSNPMLDLLDLSDADFLESNFTFNGKTKKVGQIKLSSWQNLTMHDDDAIAKVAERAVALLDNSFLSELKDSPFEGQMQL